MHLSRDDLENKCGCGKNAVAKIFVDGWQNKDMPKCDQIRFAQSTTTTSTTSD